MLYSAKHYEDLFTLPVTPDDLRTIRAGVALTRTETIKAGQMLYVRAFPLWTTQTESTRARKAKPSRDAQRKLNERNAELRLEQLANNNFGPDDIFSTFTYADGEQPDDYGAALNNMRSYLGKLRNLRRKLDLPELKYIYVIETTTSEKYGTRYHHHVLLNGGGVSRDDIENLWPHGIANTKRYQYQENQYAGIAHYMLKTKTTNTEKSHRRWNCSKNLAKPVPTISDKKISVRRMERIAMQVEADSKEIFEKAYPGYVLTDQPAVYRSDYCAGVYIRARLRRLD